MTEDAYAEIKSEIQPTGDALEELVAACKEQVAAEQKVEDLKASLETAKEEARVIREEKIPEMMARLGLKEITLEGGIELVIDEKLRMSTAKSRDPVRHNKAMKWLDENGHGGMIKRMISVEFNREQGEEAKKLAEELREKRFAVKAELDVHNRTLVSWGSTMLQEGKAFPHDLFGVQQIKYSKLK